MEIEDSQEIEAPFSPATGSLVQVSGQLQAAASLVQRPDRFLGQPQERGAVVNGAIRGSAAFFPENN
jgi:hypothetical protein